MAAITTGMVKTTLIQNRRVMPASSGFCSSSAETTLGSSAMPQIGQLPGSLRTISVCMGHTYSVRLADDGVAGSKAIPHFGQEPGPGWRISGCIGHVYSAAVEAEPDAIAGDGAGG